MKKQAILFLLVLITAVLHITSCVTTVTINDDLSPAEIIQRANEAMDRNRYGIATQYYEALGERFSNHIDLVITSKYHLAFIQYKQKNFELAREGLNDVLSYYNGPDAVFLPQHYMRLAQIVLNNIDNSANK